MPLKIQFSRIKARGHSEPKTVWDTPNFGYLPQIILKICSGHDVSRIEAIGQGLGHIDPKNRDPKVYPHIKFGIPTSNNIGDMFWTQIRL